jgi:chaperonin GroES
MLKPVGKRLLVKPAETLSDNKIIVANQKPTRFEVVAIGEEVTKVAVGNLVYLDKYAGVEIEYENARYTVIDETNILAKVLT